ncbi:MAG: hypothetical protein AAFR21_10805 [Pseudomonadota bacterium]
MPTDTTFATSWALPNRQPGRLSSAIRQMHKVLGKRRHQRKTAQLVANLNDHLRSDIGLPPLGPRQRPNQFFPWL